LASELLFASVLTLTGFNFVQEGTFGALPGVLRTRVGYTGGKKSRVCTHSQKLRIFISMRFCHISLMVFFADALVFLKPTYHDLGDHTESVQVDFDPSVVSYEQLLKVFWTTHSPRQAMPRQYMSAIWTQSDDQQKTALDSKEQQNDARIVTVIRKCTEWTNAEDYHQKFHLQQHKDICKALKLKTVEELTSSWCGAKLNGYVNGDGTAEQLELDLAKMPLSDSLKQDVRDSFRGRSRSGGSCSV
jgi:peptide-methionine (S)-S-oxide reductase